MESTETNVEGELTTLMEAVSPPTTRWRVLKRFGLWLPFHPEASFTPNDSMESTETGEGDEDQALRRGFTPNDSMESTETHSKSSQLGATRPFHPQRLDGEY